VLKVKAGINSAQAAVANAQDEIGRFTRSPEAELRIVEGGQHFLSASHPEVVDAAAVEFIRRWAS